MRFACRLRTAPGTGLARAICPLYPFSPLYPPTAVSTARSIPYRNRCGVSMHHRACLESLYASGGIKSSFPRPGGMSSLLPAGCLWRMPVTLLSLLRLFLTHSAHACAPGFGSKVQSVLCSHGKVAIAERQSGRATCCLRMNRFAVSVPIAPASQRGQGCFDRDGRKFVGWT